MTDAALNTDAGRSLQRLSGIVMSSRSKMAISRANVKYWHFDHAETA